MTKNVKNENVIQDDIDIPNYDFVKFRPKISIDLKTAVPAFKQSYLCENKFCILQGNWKGIPIFRTFNCGTIEPHISKIFAFYLGGVSDCAKLTPYFPLAREKYVEIATEQVINYYKKYIPELLYSPTVILGTAHRISGYLSCIMNAPFLPTKFQTFVNDWKILEDLKNWVGGFDLPADPLIYIWQYIAERIPKYYDNILKTGKIKNIIIVKTSNFTPMKKYKKGFLDLSVLRLMRMLSSQNEMELLPIGRLPPEFRDKGELLSDIEMRPQWEWNMEPESVETLKEVSNQYDIELIVIEEEEVALFSLVSELVLNWQLKNEIEPNRLIFNGYPLYHPFYELSTGAIPILSYTWAFKQRMNWILNFKKKFNLSKAEAYLTNFGGDNDDKFGIWLNENFDLIIKMWEFDDFDIPNSPSWYISNIIAEKYQKIEKKSFNPLKVDDLLYIIKDFHKNYKKLVNHNGDELF